MGSDAGFTSLVRSRLPDAKCIFNLYKHTQSYRRYREFKDRMKGMRISVVIALENNMVLEKEKIEKTNVIINLH